MLAIIETGALIGGLVFLTKAIKEKKDSSTRKSRFLQGGIYIALYLIMNLLCNFYFQQMQNSPPVHRGTVCAYCEIKAGMHVEMTCIPVAI